MMNIDYKRLKESVAAIVHEVESGEKDAIRRPTVRLRVVRDLQGEATAGPFIFRTDAAIDAGGFAEHPRPMDYLLAALASCQQMWCLRWAAQNDVVLPDLVIQTQSVFSWRGEYLGQVDAGMSELRVTYELGPTELSDKALLSMADTVALRCPVYATLRRAVVVREAVVRAGVPALCRQWQPGLDQAVPLDKA
jgi:Predicted redox protein, regulator of disulfide bond formation